jgi:hypothetical protein
VHTNPFTATSFVRLSLSVIALLAIFLCLTPAASAEFTALPDDVIESPDVVKADIPAHFKNIFGRSATAGEVKYWESRLRDKPRELEFLAAMRHWSEQGESPTIEDSKFTLTLSGTGRDIFVGETRRHTVTLSHTNPVAQSGYVDLKVDLKNVKPTAPLPNVQQTYKDGITRLRHTYTLEPEEELKVDLVVTVANQPTYTFEAIVHDRGISKQHVTKIYGRIPETLKTPNYHQRQVPRIFARVFDRTPSKQEMSEWRKQLNKTQRLDKIEGAMIAAKRQGTTLPTGAVLGATTGVAVETITNLFETVYNRMPTDSEWSYWVARAADKADYPSFFGAVQYHSMNRLNH